MFNTTLCYIKKDGAYLMIHRVKKKNDMNKDKWLGVGGKLEEGESPFDCAKREILYGTEYMHLFSATEFEGDIDYNCDEGTLEWVKIENVYSLPIWEGDKIFFELMEKEDRFFSLKLCYEGDKLVSHTLEF